MYPDLHRLLNPLNIPVKPHEETSLVAQLGATARATPSTGAHKKPTDTSTRTHHRGAYWGMQTSNVTPLTQPAITPMRPVLPEAMGAHQVTYNASQKAMDVVVNGHVDRQYDIAKLIHTLNGTQPDSVYNFRLFDPCNGFLTVNAIARSIRHFTSLVKLSIPIDAFRVFEVVPQLPNLKCLTVRCDATPQVNHGEDTKNVPAMCIALQHGLTHINKPIINLCIANPKPWHHELIGVLMETNKPIIQSVVASPHLYPQQAQYVFASMAPNANLANLKILILGQATDLPGYLGKPFLHTMFMHLGRAHNLTNLTLLNTELLFSDFQPLVTALTKNKTLSKMTIIMAPALRFVENLRSEMVSHFYYLGQQCPDRTFHFNVIVAKDSIFNLQVSNDSLQACVAQVNQIFVEYGFPNLKLSAMIASRG